MKHIKNSNIRTTSFEDAFFVRMKIQNSYSLPKYPHKIPKNKKTPTTSHYIYTLLSFLNRKPEPFIERVKKQQKKLSKNQVNQWIAQRQTKFKQIIERQNRTGALFIQAPSSDDKIYLRNPSEVFKLNRLIKLKRQNSCSNQSLNQSVDKKFQQRQQICRKSLQNSKSLTVCNLSPDTQRKMDKKITVFPVLLKLKQQHKTMGTSNYSDSLIQRDQNNNESNHKLRTKNNICQNINRSIRSFQHSAQSIQTLKHKKPRQEQERIQLKRSKSFLQKKNSISQSIRSFRSPLYEHKAKAPEPLKKYLPRQLSPTLDRNLVNKYSQLQNRLENILRQIRGSKKPTNY